MIVVVVAATGVDRPDIQEHCPEASDRQRATLRGAGGHVPLRGAVPQALQGRHPRATGVQA